MDLLVVLGSWGVQNNWFDKSITCKLGNISVIDFWRDRWLSVEPTSMQFPVLFEHLHKPFLKVREEDFWFGESCV